MKKTYLFAGASSAIAKQAAVLLKEKGHAVIGISTKADVDGYEKLFTIDAYDFGEFPAVDDAIDGIVYFPGTINLKPFARLTSEEFEKDLHINCLGAVAFTQAYINVLKKSNNASIIFISSVAVSIGLPVHSSIAMAKGAIEGLTKSLAAEFAPVIRVNCIAPSLVNTPLGSKFLDTSDKMEAMQKRNPLRKVGEPKDVAYAIAYLLSDESAWVTGQVFSIDGGMGTIKN